jgi:hypothetical protein
MCPWRSDWGPVDEPIHVRFVERFELGEACPDELVSGTENGH